jgi:enoyl-CoA hydratase/carnithine racemase
MGEIITDRSQSILRVELNRPAKTNAMTSRMYVMLADIFNEAAKDDGTSVVSGTAQETLSAPATISRIFCRILQDQKSLHSLNSKMRWPISINR